MEPIRLNAHEGHPCTKKAFSPWLSWSGAPALKMAALHSRVSWWEKGSLDERRIQAVPKHSMGRVRGLSSDLLWYCVCVCVWFFVSFVFGEDTNCCLFAGVGAEAIVYDWERMCPLRANCWACCFPFQNCEMCWMCGPKHPHSCSTEVETYTRSTEVVIVLVLFVSTHLQTSYFTSTFTLSNHFHTQVVKVFHFPDKCFKLKS